MKAKKKYIYIFYSSHRLKNHFFLSLTPCLCLSPKSLSSHSLSQITLSPCLSFSPKSPIIKLSSSRPSHPKVPNHSPSLLSHRHALSLISHSSVDWVWLWDRIDGVWLFHGCAPVGFYGCAPMGFCGYEIGFVGWWGDGVVVCGGVTTVVDSWWS